MWTVLTFTCILRHYNVDSSHIYLFAEASQCREYSLLNHLTFVYKATMMIALLKNCNYALITIGQIWHSSVCKCYDGDRRQCLHSSAKALQM